MCGIVTVFGIQKEHENLRSEILEMSKKIRHRGPDWSGVFEDNNIIMAHERLSIVDPSSGKQPLISNDDNIILAVNGEIYNHKELEKNLNNVYKFKTKSDCEVLIPLYQQKDINFLNDLNGIFGFTLYDKSKNRFIIARDHMGIIPLYYGFDKKGAIYVASELKALEGQCNKIEVFLPGHVYDSETKEFTKWYNPNWKEYNRVKDNVSDIQKIKTGLSDAVKRQLMCDVPYGVLLSGGLDSSVISALAKQFANKRIEEDENSTAWWPNLHSFAVGLESSPDLIAARKVAEHIGTVHHEVNFTVQEGFDALNDVIYKLETYDVTTVRASTPMYLLARVIKSMGIKMVLSGEGSDELFGGYLYFHKAPNSQEFHEETVRKLDKLYLYDCLRANKSLAAWGIEGRVPFLDKEFIDIAMNINPEDKMVKDKKIEKWILRKAFEDILPESIAWRQKEQFSDGVGYSWIDSLKQLVNNEVSDEQMKNVYFRFPINPPQSKEEYYYRTIFEKYFPSETAAKTVAYEKSVACSTAKALEWDESFKNMNEPSGRAINIHNDKY